MANIRDVGKAAGVSPTTVSRVLNRKDSDHVSEETRKRVLEAADRLNYRPSAAARALVGGRTRTIALHSSPVIYTSYFSHLTSHIQTILDEHGYHLMLVPGGHEDELRNLLRERRVDAVIWARYPVERAAVLQDAISASHQQIVGIGSIDEAPPSDCRAAWWNDAIGTRQAVEHLASLGHSHIAFLPGIKKNVDLWPNMRDAFRQSCAEHDLEGIITYAERQDHSFAAGVEMAEKVAKMASPPTGLIGLNDDYALGILNGLLDAGVRVPEEMSVVGYNDLPVASYTRPPLTTVACPYLEAVRDIVPGLLNDLENGSDSGGRQNDAREFRTTLMERETTGPPPG